MSSLETARPAVFNICSVLLVLLCAEVVQGQLEPTVALATPVSLETAPTWHKSHPDDIWEGSGMPSSTPTFHGSQQDYLSHPAVLQTLENTPFLPSLSKTTILETNLLYSQELRSADFNGTLRLSTGDSSAQQTHFSAPKTFSPTESLSIILPNGSLSSIYPGTRATTTVESVTSTSDYSSSLISSSLKPTPCSSKDNSQTSGSFAPDKTDCTSENFSSTLSVRNETEASSIATLVSQISHRTTEEPKSPFSFSTTKLLSDNETGTFTSVPEILDEDTKESHYTLFLRSRKCPHLFANELQKELSEKTFKSANYSTLRWNFMVESCTSHLNVSIRTKGSSILDHVISQFNTLERGNISIRVLNRTFYVVHIQKHEDFSANRTLFDSNSTITIVSDSEFAAYISVGVSFGIMLVASLTLCCAKFCIRRPRKPLGTSRSSQMHLRFEDYTLTPIPRPSSLYVDYYRGSVVGDHYSTTSAGSITSTPTVEQGVVQPFDTCIVPLEDSETVPEDAVKRPLHDPASVTHVPNLSLHPVANPILAHCINTKSESNERLHPKYQKAGGDKNSGLANPTFQRY